MTSRVSWILAAVLTGVGAQAAPISWSSDYSAGLQAARRTGKLMMVAFHIDWSPWCRRMDTRIYSDPQVARVAGSMIAVKLNADREGQALAERFHVTGYPTVLFVNGRGEVVSAIDKYEEAASFAMDAMKADRLYRELPLLRERLARTPNDAEANARLATALAWKGRTGEAERALARARAANYRGPERALALNAIGDNYQTAGRYSQAILRFAKADACTVDPSVRSYARMSTMYCQISLSAREAARKAARSVVSLKGADQEWVDAANRYLEQDANALPIGTPHAG